MLDLEHLITADSANPAENNERTESNLVVSQVAMRLHLFFGVSINNILLIVLVTIGVCHGREARIVCPKVGVPFGPELVHLRGSRHRTHLDAHLPIIRRALISAAVTLSPGVFRGFELRSRIRTGAEITTLPLSLKALVAASGIAVHVWGRPVPEGLWARIHANNRNAQTTSSFDQARSRSTE